MDNAILKPENNVPARIAQRTLAKRGADYASEVRRLLDAALEVMRQGGTASRPRVADIVAAAGLSEHGFRAFAGCLFPCPVARKSGAG